MTKDYFFSSNHAVALPKVSGCARSTARWRRRQRRRFWQRIEFCRWRPPNANGPQLGRNRRRPQVCLGLHHQEQIQNNDPLHLVVVFIYGPGGRILLSLFFNSTPVANDIFHLVGASQISLHSCLFCFVIRCLDFLKRQRRTIPEQYLCLISKKITITIQLHDGFPRNARFVKKGRLHLVSPSFICFNSSNEILDDLKRCSSRRKYLLTILILFQFSRYPSKWNPSKEENQTKFAIDSPQILLQRLGHFFLHSSSPNTGTPLDLSRVVFDLPLRFSPWLFKLFFFLEFLKRPESKDEPQCRRSGERERNLSQF